MTNQRKQRSKKMITSELLEIPGVGQKTVQRLMKHFGSVKRVKEASREELIQVVGPALADKILNTAPQ